MEEFVQNSANILMEKKKDAGPIINTHIYMESHTEMSFWDRWIQNFQ